MRKGRRQTVERKGGLLGTGSVERWEWCVVGRAGREFEGGGPPVLENE